MGVSAAAALLHPAIFSYTGLERPANEEMAPKCKILATKLTNKTQEGQDFTP